MTEPEKAIRLLQDLINVADHNNLGLLEPTQIAALATEALDDLEKFVARSKRYEDVINRLAEEIRE